MIVITGATGQIGSQLLASLIDGVEPIRLIVRDPGKLSTDVLGRVEVVKGSYAERDVVMKAFDGADAVFWLPSASHTAESAEIAFVEMSRPAAEAIARHGIRHVVSVSALGRGWPTEAGHATASIHMDDMLAATGANLRALACPGLMDNMLRQARLIKEASVFCWPAPGDFKVPQVATRDVADAAAALLRDRAWSGARDVPLLGPEDLSCNDQARIMSEVLGKQVAFREISMAEMKAMTLGQGASEGMAQALIDMAAAKNAGLDHMVARSPENTTATSFRSWCEKVLKRAVQGV
jgi:uncharacterized protein YbjT (DUF2867 family)